MKKKTRTGAIKRALQRMPWTQSKRKQIQGSKYVIKKIKRYAVATTSPAIRALRRAQAAARRRDTKGRFA
jgi:hypothetical protein